jgi:hypothetical protein
VLAVTHFVLYIGQAFKADFVFSHSRPIKVASNSFANFAFEPSLGDTFH